MKLVLEAVALPEWQPAARRRGRFTMQDVVMLLFTTGFFVVAFLYVKACQKLR